MESDESGAKKLSQIHLSPARRFPNGRWIGTREPGIFNCDVVMDLSPPSFGSTSNHVGCAGAKETDLLHFSHSLGRPTITARLGSRSYIVLEAYAGISQHEEDIAL